MPFVRRKSHRKSVKKNGHTKTIVVKMTKAKVGKRK
jgi:hypothetical protein